MYELIKRRCANDMTKLMMFEVKRPKWPNMATLYHTKQDISSPCVDLIPSFTGGILEQAARVMIYRLSSPPKKVWIDGAWCTTVSMSLSGKVSGCRSLPLLIAESGWQKRQGYYLGLVVNHGRNWRFPGTASDLITGVFRSSSLPCSLLHCTMTRTLLLLIFKFGG